jgi:predicted amidophosphoribosyltransferase
MRDGEIERVIGRYKFNDKQHWATIFARVLVGFLEENPDTFRGFDLIVASPSYISRDGEERSWDHTRRVIEIAHAESRGEWPFDVGGASKAIVKTAATPKMTKQTNWKKRDEIARTELRNALKVPDPRRTTGRSILVYDDVFTDGHTLNEVARCLIKQGHAESVCGVTLARQPWKKPPAI